MQVNTISFNQANPGQAPCGYRIDREWQLNFIKCNSKCPSCLKTLSQEDIQPLSKRKVSRLNELVKFFSKRGSLEYCGTAQALALGYSFCRFLCSNCTDPIPINCLDGRLLAKSSILMCTWFCVAAGFSMPRYFQSHQQISSNTRHLTNLGTIATTFANQHCLFETMQESHTLTPMVLFDLGVISGCLGLFSHIRDILRHGNENDFSQLVHCFFGFIFNAALIVMINQLFWDHSNNF